MHPNFVVLLHVWTNYICAKFQIFEYIAHILNNFPCVASKMWLSQYISTFYGAHHSYLHSNYLRNTRRELSKSRTNKLATMQEKGIGKFFFDTPQFLNYMSVVL